MSRTHRFVGAALAWWVVAAGANFAQALKAKNVLGSKVSLKGGQAIGTVEDMIFSDDGTLDYLVVRYEGKYVFVPWQAAKFDFEKHVATLEVPQEKWREVPTFTQETWPNVYEPAFQQKVYGYYGLTPRERRIERRIERRP